MSLKLSSLEDLFDNYDLIIPDTCAIKNSLDTASKPLYYSKRSNELTVEEFKSYYFWLNGILDNLDKRGEIIMHNLVLRELKDGKSLPYNYSIERIEKNIEKLAQNKNPENFGLNTKCCDENRKNFLKYINEHNLILIFNEDEKRKFDLIYNGLSELGNSFKNGFMKTDYSLIVSAITLSKFYERVCIISNDREIHKFVKLVKSGKSLINGNLNSYSRNTFNGFLKYL